MTFYVFFLILVIILPTKCIQLTQNQDELLAQILKTYVIQNSDESLCAKHNEKLTYGVRNFEPWALSMLDASSKLQSGILSGTYAELGSFYRCIGIQFEDIRGKHCYLKINLPENLRKFFYLIQNPSEKRYKLISSLIEKSIYWSICVPESCSSHQVLNHVQKLIANVTFGLNTTISLDDKHCAVSIGITDILGIKEYSILFLLISFVASVLFSTFLSLVKRSKAPIISALSLKSNFYKFIKINPKEIGCLQGLRFSSCAYLVLFHRFVMLSYTPTINSLESYNMLGDWYISLTTIGGFFIVDTFFFISGFLTSINFFRQISKPSLFELYLNRYIRLTPIVAIILPIFTTDLIKLFTSGPLWHDLHDMFTKPCQKYWWSTLLHLQSYVNPENLCIPHSWSISCEMVFCLVSPIILYPLYKNQIIGLINCITVYILSISISLYIAWNENLTIILQKNVLEMEYFLKHYTLPHVRISVYLLGLIYGYYQYKCFNRKRKIGIFYNLLLWTIAGVSIVLAISFNYRFLQDDYEYNRLESALLLTFGRQIWTLGIICIVWACTNGNGGVISYVWSLPVFSILGKLTYGIYLLSIPLQLFTNADNKVPVYFSHISKVYYVIGDLILLTTGSFLMVMFFEMPLINIAKIFLRKIKKSHSA